MYVKDYGMLLFILWIQQYNQTHINRRGYGQTIAQLYNLGFIMSLIINNNNIVHGYFSKVGVTETSYAESR